MHDFEHCNEARMYAGVMAEEAYGQSLRESWYWKIMQNPRRVPMVEDRESYLVPEARSKRLRLLSVIHGLPGKICSSRFKMPSTIYRSDYRQL